jgi:hypothetical protein
MMSDDPVFGEWLSARASMYQARVQQPSTTSQTTSLVDLAAWLHRMAKQAEASCAKEDAERFKLASDLVKQAADRKWQVATDVHRPTAANEG